MRSYKKVRSELNTPLSDSDMDLIEVRQRREKECKRLFGHLMSFNCGCPFKLKFIVNAAYHGELNALYRFYWPLLNN